MKKPLIIYCSIFLFNLLSSCGPDCSCPKNLIDTDFESVEVSLYDISDGWKVPVSNSVPKNAFGLNSYLDIQNSEFASMSRFGFSQANACDCVFTYKPLDPVNSVTVLLINDNNPEGTEWTINFSYSYSEQDGTLKDYFNKHGNSLRLDLVKFDELPESGSFQVIIELESGRELIDQTATFDFL